MNQANYTQQAVQGLKQDTPKEQIFQSALGPLEQSIAHFNQLMGEVSAQVNQICQVAIDLGNYKRSVIKQPQENDALAQGISNAAEIYDNLDFGLGFYGQLMMHLNDLDRKVSDFVMARNIEKDDLVHQA